MSLQNRLFSFTITGNLLIGSQVIKAERTKQVIKQLQRNKLMVENWTLDIFCRDPAIISDIIITSIDSTSALGSRWKYGISIVNTPTSTCISPYELTVAWFETLEEAEEMVDTIRAYIDLRYRV